ncbi:MAG: FIST C-terminal domain-containing protein [Burkholderiales bacterium]|nr:FIST C-terminal domain-containing protein [Burkholderiales bacterium]
MSLVVFFCSSQYDFDTVAAEINRYFVDIPMIGCSTAGEIGPVGYRHYGIAGFSFPASLFTVVTGCLERLQQFEIGQGYRFARQLLQQLDCMAPNLSSRNCFGFLLIDGMSKREEPVARALQNALGDINLFGGSASDELWKLANTWVFHEGRFHADSAVLVLCSTQLPFEIFKTQHFVSENEKLVVTEADASRRLVKELNGLPAAAEYARVIGVDINELGPQRFATSPVVVKIDGTDYVRSIQKANSDGSLGFYCAIDEGLVLRVVHGVDLVGNLRRTFDRLQSHLGTPQLTIVCDCILRDLEIAQNSMQDEVEDIFLRNHAVGFSTFGEQFHGVHINQTLTGIAFGTPYA